MKKLLILAVAVLAFAACNKKDKPVDTIPDDLVINATGVEGLSAGTVVANESVTGALIATGTAGSGGWFTITLPGVPANLAALLSTDFFAGLTLSDPAAMGFAVTEFDVYDGEDLLGGLIMMPADEESEILLPAYYLYADRAVTVTGTRAGDEYDLQLSKGWNKVWESYDMATGDVHITSSGPAVEWFFDHVIGGGDAHKVLVITAEGLVITEASVADIPAEAVTVKAVGFGGIKVFATTTISDEGIALALPDETFFSPSDFSPIFGLYSFLSLPDDLVFSDPGAKGARAFLDVYDNEDRNIGIIWNMPSIDGYSSVDIRFAYVDRDITINGTTDFLKPPFSVELWTYDVDLNFKKGWNVFLYMEDSEHNYCSYISPIPSTVGNNWFFHPFA